MNEPENVVLRSKTHKIYTVRFQVCEVSRIGIYRDRKISAHLGLERGGNGSDSYWEQFIFEDDVMVV